MFYFIVLMFITILSEYLDSYAKDDANFGPLLLATINNYDF